MPAAHTARSRVLWLTLCCAVVGVAGAAQPKPKAVAKLDVSKHYELEEAEAKGLYLPAQPDVQTFTVEFASAKCPVSVYVFKEEDAKGDDAPLDADPKKALAGATATAGMLKVEVPVKTETLVAIRGATAKTTVKLRLTNQLVVDTKDDRIKKLEDENAALKKELAETKQQLADLKKRSKK